ncbi:MAG: outer membrane beta-barrel protein [Deltaproteobacteria bacterium]|nr:outer membrane beta-barrel protein [Deltaproteobacteria bacterium]
MVLRSLVAVTVVALPSLAAAESRLTAGVHLGVHHSKADGVAGKSANDTLGLFGRLGFNKRVSGQLEVQKIQAEDGSNVEIRTGTASLIIDLTQGKSRLVPTLAAGMGLDSAASPYGGSTSGHHFEGGVGLEYRADGGLTVGAELRIGGRSVDQDDRVVPLNDGPSISYYAPTMREGEYRSARLFVGVRF